MKKVGDLFAELGFRADASDSVKRAFVENLVRAANGSSKDAPALSPKPNRKETKKPDNPQQLSFDFGSDSPSSLFSHVSQSKSQRRSG